MRVAWFSLLLALAAAAQDGSKKEEEARTKPGEVEVPEGTVPIADRSAARTKASQAEKALRAADSPEKEAEIIRKLGRWDHPEVFKVLKKHLDDRDHRVAVQAALACARQKSSEKKAGRALLRALMREKRDVVVCALLVGLGVTGNDSRFARREAEKWFKRDTTETHKAAARYFGYIKDKSAFRMLAEKLDEPRPARIDDPKNPPASWWKARWHEWESNLPYIRWALSEIVPGETFETKREAEEWAKSEEGRKRGIEW